MKVFPTIIHMISAYEHFIDKELIEPDQNFLDNKHIKQETVRCLKETCNTAFCSQLSIQNTYLPSM